MVLRNIVDLQAGQPARMHFTDHQLVRKEIVDPDLGRPKGVTALVFVVDELDGQRVAATYSVLAEKLAKKLEPWLAGNRYREVDFRITKTGRGYQTQYSMETLPRV